jgi:hypothetical protein
MSRARRGHRSGQLFALAAEGFPPVQSGVASLSTKELKRKCNEYFALLDQLNPPECLLTDYEEACDELRQRLTKKKAISPKVP